MDITLQIGPDDEYTPRAFAEIIRSVLSGFVHANRLALRHRLVPPLYESGVYYQAEPYPEETFRDALTTYRIGHGDCAHLAAWRVAELQELAGEPAGIVISAEQSRHDPDQQIFHVFVRRGYGHDVFEDPSRNLGMQ